MKAEIWKWMGKKIDNVGAFEQLNTNPDVVVGWISWHFFFSSFLELLASHHIIHKCVVHFFFRVLCLPVITVRRSSHWTVNGCCFFFIFFLLKTCTHIIECGNQARIDHDHYCFIKPLLDIASISLLNSDVFNVFFSFQCKRMRLLFLKLSD